MKFKEGTDENVEKTSEVESDLDKEKAMDNMRNTFSPEKMKRIEDYYSGKADGIDEKSSFKDKAKDIFENLKNHFSKQGENVENDKDAEDGYSASYLVDGKFDKEVPDKENDADIVIPQPMKKLENIGLKDEEIKETSGKETDDTEKSEKDKFIETLRKDSKYENTEINETASKKNETGSTTDANDDSHGDEAPIIERDLAKDMAYDANFEKKKSRDDDEWER